MSWDKTLVSGRPSFAETDDDEHTDSGIDPNWFERKPRDRAAQSNTLVERPTPSPAAARRPKDLLSLWRPTGGAAVPIERPSALPPPLPPPPVVAAPPAPARRVAPPPPPVSSRRTTVKGHAPVLIVPPQPGSMVIDDAADTWPPERTPLPPPQSLIRTAEVARIDPEPAREPDVSATVPVPLFSPDELLGPEIVVPAEGESAPSERELSVGELGDRPAEPALAEVDTASFAPGLFAPVSVAPASVETEPPPVTMEPERLPIAPFPVAPVFNPTREIVLAPVAPEPTVPPAASVIVDPLVVTPSVTDRGFASVAPPTYLPTPTVEAPPPSLLMPESMSASPAEQTWFEQGGPASPEPAAAPIWTPPADTAAEPVWIPPSEPAATWSPPVAPVEPLQAPAPDAPSEGLAKRGKVIVVFGCRGGTGCTTITVNLASALARAGKEVCVVDLDLLLGDVLVALDLEPKISVTAVAREGITMDGPALKRRLQRHDAGFYALAQAGRIDDMDDEIAQRVPELLRVLASHFDAVIIDGLRDFADHAVAAMDAADEIALVFTQDVTGVRRASRVVELCRKLGYGDRKLRLLLNRHHANSRVKTAEIERALGLPVFACVSNDYRATQAAQDAGVVLTDLRRRTRVADDVARLATDLVRDPNQPLPPKSGFFARLFGGGK